MGFSDIERPGIASELCKKVSSSVQYRYHMYRYATILKPLEFTIFYESCTFEAVAPVNGVKRILYEDFDAPTGQVSLH